MTKGDGTVPLISAERKGFIDDLNAPGATLRIFSNPFKADNGFDHTGLTKNPDVHQQILEFLDRGPTATTLTASEQRVSLSQANQESLPEVKPAFYLQVTGVESVTVTDAFGDSTNDLGDTPMLKNVPGVTTYIRGEKSFLVIVDSEQDYTVTFRSGTDPIALEITKGTDVTTTMAIRYQDLSLPEGVGAMLKIGPDASMGVERLTLDSDRDGTFETEVTPTVEVEGPDAEDVEAPTIEFRSAVRRGKVLVDITAEDMGTGVKALFYSLDGTRFFRYTGTVRLRPAKTLVVHAFADDNVANRSSTATFEISCNDDGSQCTPSRPLVAPN